DNISTTGTVTASGLDVGTGPLSLNDLADVTITSAAQGDVFYRDATGWVNLAAGLSGQVLQSGGTGANPAWVDNAGTTALGGSWRFSTTITSGDPGTRNFRLNTAAQTTATEMYISDIAESGVDMSAVLAALPIGTRIYMQDERDALSFHLVTTTAVGVDQTGWFTFTITVEDSGVIFNNNDRVGFLFFIGIGAFGDVFGPPSSTDNALVRYDGTTGKNIQASTGWTLDDTGILDGSAGDFIFPTAPTPTQTTEGQAVWDTNDDHLRIGSGAATITLIDDGTAAGGDVGGTFPDTLTVTDLTMTGEAQGTLVYFDGTNWVVLPVGTAGQLLQTNGAGADPTWTSTLTIGDFTNAAHDHENAAGGGQLDHGLAMVAASLLDDDHPGYVLLTGNAARNVFSGTLDAGTGGILLPSVTTPAQTAEGSIVWDSDNDLLTIGDGTGRVTLVDTAGTQTLSNKTLVTPTIASFVNAAHDHEDAAGGGQLDHGLAMVAGSLLDDDHTIYSLADGTRAFTGVVGGITPTAATHLTTKSYVDAFVAGLTWQGPVDVKDYLGTRTVTQINALSPLIGESVVAGDAGTPTAGTSDAVSTGDLVEFDGTSWKVIVTNSGGFPPDGTRALVATDPVTLYSPLTDNTDEGKIVEWAGASLTPSFTTPTDGDALTIRGEGSVNENRQFVFDGTVPTGDWILFSSSGAHFDLGGLAWVGGGHTGTANTLASFDGSGGAELISKTVSGDVAGTLPGPLTVTDLTMTGEAQGDVLYFDGTNWVVLPAGTAGQVLQTNGAGADPTWITPTGGGSAVWMGFSLTSSSGSAYIRITSAAYTTAASIGWLGSDNVATPISIHVLVVLSGGSSMDWRIYDSTNAAVIAEVTGQTNTAWMDINLGTLSNITTAGATWDIQGRCAGGGRKADIASVVMVF
ncbi:hypothetical protein N9917_04910, partial [Deltaproteobacteria bacterium]|nr:hypothetical protein [Deltaproteobacteria bacterium]